MTADIQDISFVIEVLLIFRNILSGFHKACTYFSREAQKHQYTAVPIAATQKDSVLHHLHLKSHVFFYWIFHCLHNSHLPVPLA